MPDPGQPRKSFVKESIERLAASMAARGVLTPLRVRWDAERQAYIIVTGESRWRAAGIAGLDNLPCLVVEGEISEADILADQLTENAVRSDLRPLEFARGMVKLKALRGVDAKTLACELGISSSSLTRAEALLSLPLDIQALVDDGSVPESTAYEISRLPDETAMRELAQAVANKRVSRDSVAEIVRERIGKRQAKPKGTKLSGKVDELSFSLSSGQPLTWDSVNGFITRLSKAAEKLHKSGKEVSELAKSFRVSG
jgi:ParB family chromosome partitioning protein